MINTAVCSGRLGNRIFQNLAVDAVCCKLQIDAKYDKEDECEKLGIHLFHTSNKYLAARKVALTESVAQDILDKSLYVFPTAVSRTSFFQTPYFAHLFYDRLKEARNRLSEKQRSNTIFVHMRLGDREHACRSAADYIQAIQNVKETNDQVYVASDTPNHPNVKQVLQACGAQLVQENEVQTILFGATCNKLVLSDGTFSWLIGALSSASSVQVLPSRNGRWHGDIFVFEKWTIVS